MLGARLHSFRVAAGAADGLRHAACVVLYVSENTSG